MRTYYEVIMGAEEMVALRAAINMGALAERQLTLQTLIRSNVGHQTADTYERELCALERAVSCVQHAQPKES